MHSDIRQQLDAFETPLTVINSKYLYAEIKPQAKQSTKFGRGHSYTPKKKRMYLEELATKLGQTFDGVPMEGQLRVAVVYSFPWRKTDKDREPWALMDRRPDIDNLFKPLADCLEAVGVFGDDAQIVEVTIRKIRHDIPAISVKISSVNSPSFKRV
jgi:Holliday junction resolvase RusA-like endonuclease